MVIDPSPAPDPAQDAPALDTTDSLRALSMREDLVVVPMQFGGRKYWSIKDPLADRYFQLREEEYFVLQQLDGNASTATIQARFEQEFALRRISESQLHRFVGMLHRQGLLVAKLMGQAQQLLARRNRMRRMQKLQLMTSVLAIRFRGIDPQRLLTWLYPKCRWMFSKWCVALCMMTALAAIGLVIIQFETLQAKLPRFSDFFSRENVIWIGVSLSRS